MTGLDQGDFAARVQISRTTVVNYEAGHRTPRALYLQAWSVASGVDLGWIMSGEAPAPAESLTEEDSTGAGGGVRPKGFEPPTFCSVVQSDWELAA